MTPRTHYRELTIIAQDPSVSDKDRVLTATVKLPAEDLLDGPRGFRVHVIDYDASHGVMYRPYGALLGREPDPFKGREDLLTSPQFHAQNVYAIVMRVLCRFEKALGRRVSWSFPGHQLKIAPHAFAEANAYYSSTEQALLFGYFVNAQGRTIFTCLSHDIIAHETAHALLDGLRNRYVYPSGPDQAAFHEGFSDVVALLSIFSLPEVVEFAIREVQSGGLINTAALTIEKLRDGILFGIGEQFGAELGEPFGALRRSAELEPGYAVANTSEFLEPHRRGELLVAAVLQSMLKAYATRLETLGRSDQGYLPPARVAEEGADIADRLLTMVIRALDYSPPTDLEFGDYLSAILTADYEAQPDDSRYKLRKHLLESFQAFGIKPSSNRDDQGLWEPPLEDLQPNERGELVFGCTRHDALQFDRDEVFRYLWDNRRLLKICEEAYIRVQSVRPCVRVTPEGFTIRETVADYLQVFSLHAQELSSLHIEAPAGLDPDAQVTLYGGGALIFDDFGRLKYHIGNAVRSPRKQSRRLRYLFENGQLGNGRLAAKRNRPCTAKHLNLRGASLPAATEEESWPAHF